MDRHQQKSNFTVSDCAPGLVGGGRVLNTSSHPVSNFLCARVRGHGDDLVRRDGWVHALRDRKRHHYLPHPSPRGPVWSPWRFIKLSAPSQAGKRCLTAASSLNVQHWEQIIFLFFFGLNAAGSFFSWWYNRRQRVGTFLHQLPYVKRTGRFLEEDLRHFTGSAYGFSIYDIALNR